MVHFWCGKVLYITTATMRQSASQQLPAVNKPTTLSSEAREIDLPLLHVWGYSTMYRTTRVSGGVQSLKVYRGVLHILRPEDANTIQQLCYLPDTLNTLLCVLNMCAHLRRRTKSPDGVGQYAANVRCQATVSLVSDGRRATHTSFVLRNQHVWLFLVISRAP